MDVSYYGDVVEVAKQTAYDLASMGEITAQIMMPHPYDEDSVLVLSVPFGMSFRRALCMAVHTFKPIFYVAFAESRMKVIPADDTQIIQDILEHGGELPERYQNISQDTSNQEVLLVTGRIRGDSPHTYHANIHTNSEGRRTIDSWESSTGLCGALSEIDW